MGQGVIGVVAKRRRIIRMGNIGASMAYVSAVRARMAEVEGEADLHEMVKLPGLPNVQSQIGIPLLAKKQLIGVFAVESSRPNAFDDLDEMLLTILANQAAISIDNARLYSNLEQRVAERTQELREKNDALEKTLQQLRDTQNQLIQGKARDSFCPTATKEHRCLPPEPCVHISMHTALQSDTLSLH